MERFAQAVLVCLGGILTLAGLGAGAQAWEESQVWSSNFPDNSALMEMSQHYADKATFLFGMAAVGLVMIVVGSVWALRAAEARRRELY